MKSYLIIMVIIVVVATHFTINEVKQRKWVLRRNRVQNKITLIHTRLSQRPTRSRPLCPPSAVVLTCVNESSRCPFAELFGFVGQGDLYNTRDMPRRSLHTDGMRSNQLVGDIWGKKNIVIAICKGLISQLSYRFSINIVFKHLINLSMFKYNHDGTCIKDTDNNIYKCSENSHNNFIFMPCFPTWQALCFLD